MSVEVQNVTKLYGEQKALDNVSFSIAKGEVIGFLGPNGAGKSTLMKIITCFIPPTSGDVWVEGISINDDPLAIKRKIGYLPEHNPLYLEMYVKEYLEYAGKVHKVQDLKNRVKEMVSMTGLEREQNKKIGMLSKGYRQRVGLAQAMIHDPEVLILDEPTSGLDPNQLTEIRSLIKSVGGSKTIMLSTHIMQEVEAMCDKVIIINQGKIVADASAGDIHKLTGNKLVYSIEFDKDPGANRLKNIKGVTAVKNAGGNIWLIEAGRDIRSELFNFAVSNGLTVLEMQKQEQKLEEVFRKLTTGKGN